MVMRSAIVVRSFEFSAADGALGPLPDRPVRGTEAPRCLVRSLRRRVHDDRGHILWLRKHRHVARVQFRRRCLHAFCEKSSSSGAIAWSFLPTMYHDAFVFHATLDTLVPKAETTIGPCIAARARASVDRLMKPCLSMIGAANVGGGG